MGNRRGTRLLVVQIHIPESISPAVHHRTGDHAEGAFWESSPGAGVISHTFNVNPIPTPVHRPAVSRSPGGSLGRTAGGTRWLRRYGRTAPAQSLISDETGCYAAACGNMDFPRTGKEQGTVRVCTSVSMDGSRQAYRPPHLAWGHSCLGACPQQNFRTRPGGLVATPHSAH